MVNNDSLVSMTDVVLYVQSAAVGILVQNASFAATALDRCHVTELRGTVQWGVPTVDGALAVY